MANDLIGFGNDITKVRAQIPENLEVIYSPVFQKELTERLSTMLTLFPYTTLFRSSEERRVGKECKIGRAHV